MTEKNTSLSLLVCCLGISAIAQNAPRGYAKLIPDGSGGFRIIHLVDTLSTTARLNKKLDTISAAFYQISDSILTSPGHDAPGEYFSGSLRNSFSQAHQLSMGYFIRSNKYSGGAFAGIVHKTNRLVSLIDSTDTDKRDSIIDSEYKRFIASLLNRNVLSNGDSCYSREQAISHTDYDKKILNADSVIIVQYISPPYGTCAIGLNKDVIIYKQGLGYVILGYGLIVDWDRNISFGEASDLLDELIRQTWGIIRFDKE